MGKINTKVNSNKQQKILTRANSCEILSRESSIEEVETGKLATQVITYSDICKNLTEHKMVVEVPAMSSGADSKLSKAVRNSLWTAQNENRVIVGLSEAVRSLSTISDDALFCIMAPPKKGDTATHMHEVLLQAYCFENDIYLIQVRIRFLINF